MNLSIRPFMFAVLSCFLLVGCSSSEPTNVIGNASQEELDNYNRLIEQAENEMAEDGEITD